jgi:SnoaL-like domain
MADDALRTRLQEMIDRADIHDCIVRYARGIDRFDRELLRSAYHDGAIDDHVGFVGLVDDFIDWAFAYHSTQTRHQHYLLNQTADIDGDVAHAETYYLFVGTDREPENHLTINGGRYVDRLERRDGGWGITARVCMVEWQTEATTLITAEAVELLAGVQTTARDRTDTSYIRPLVITRASPG